MFWKRWDCKYYMGVISIYTLLVTISIGCVFMETDRAFKQLEFYKSGGYHYVYEATRSTGENNYLNCSSVYFYTDREMSKSLFGECFMMLDKPNIYNSVTPLNLSKKLGSREIALTYNLAKQYHLDVGSKVYSKHNIENQIEEYTIAEILPISYGVLQMDCSINYGYMLIGYDEEYVQNTDYTFVGFSCEDPSALIQSSRVGLITLERKETTEKRLETKLFLWQSSIFTMVIILTVLYAIMHWKKQKKYYNRLEMEGCPVKTLRKLILKDIMMPGVIGLFSALIFSAIFLSIHNYYFSFLSSLISVFSGLCALVASIWFILQKLRNG